MAVCTEKTMGKSIRSKSKRAFRAIKRKELHAPAERKKKMETLSNLRRCIGSQTSATASADQLRAMVSGSAPTTLPVQARGALPDACEGLGLTKFKDEMDAAEADVIAKQNDHFHFKRTVAPDWEEPVMWRTAGPSTKKLEDMLEARLQAELARNAPAADDVRARKKEETRRRERKAKKKQQMKRRRRANNVKRP